MPVNILRDTFLAYVAALESPLTTALMREAQACCAAIKRDGQMDALDTAVALL